MEDFTRPKNERLKLIRALLRERTIVTRRIISDRCGSSPKTAKRDIDHLRDLGWPIEGSHEGYFLRKPSMAEMRSAVDAHFGVLMIAGCSIDTNIGTLMPDVSKLIKDSVFELDEVDEIQDNALVKRATSVPKTIYTKEQLTLFGVLARHIVAELAVSFSYRKIGATESTRREVFPIQLKLKQGVWYLMCWDYQRKGARAFKLVKMKDVGVLDSQWKRPGRTIINKILNSGELSIWDRGTEDLSIKIKVTDAAEEFIQNQKLTPNQKYEQRNGYSILTIRSADIIGICNWCRRFVWDVEILEPQKVKQAYLESLQAGIEKH